MLTTIAKLIAWMRDCGTLQDCYDFQRCLFGYLYKTQERHQECSRRKAAPAGKWAAYQRAGTAANR